MIGLKNVICISVYRKTYGYKYMMEYYSTIRDNEITPFAETWVDLENITPMK